LAHHGARKIHGIPSLLVLGHGQLAPEGVIEVLGHSIDGYL
jgi:hypothetical protein